MIEDCLCGHGVHPFAPPGPCPAPGCGCQVYRAESAGAELEVETPTPTPVVDQEVVVTSVEFSVEGMQVAYMVVPDDVRDQGRLVSSHSMAISIDAEEVGDDVVLLREHAERVVTAALRVWQDADIAEPDADTDDEDDDDDRGMGD